MSMRVKTCEDVRDVWIVLAVGRRHDGAARPRRGPDDDRELDLRKARPVGLILFRARQRKLRLRQPDLGADGERKMNELIEGVGFALGLSSLILLGPVGRLGLLGECWSGQERGDEEEQPCALVRAGRHRFDLAAQILPCM
jgi:hypothetical protein